MAAFFAYFPHGLNKSPRHASAKGSLKASALQLSSGLLLLSISQYCNHSICMVRFFLPIS